MQLETQPARNTRVMPTCRKVQDGLRNAVVHAMEDSSGSELVEIALAMPIFLMVIIAICQFAIVMFNYESASFAIRQAARYGSTHSLTSLNPCTNTQIASMVQDYLWSPTGSSTVSVSWPAGNTVGNTIKVSVSESYNIVLFNSSFSAVNITNSVQYAIVR